MFLKNLIIENDGKIIRDIPFHKGINLIVDETKTADRKETGNSVGKTTVLRLIDFCLGSDGTNIYKDTEFRTKTNTVVEHFLKNNNIIITLNLIENLDDTDSNKIELRKNFLSYGEKIQEINGKQLNNPEYLITLKELIFHSKREKPTFRQVISKNIRDEKNRLVNTLKVLHPNTKLEEYEALYLFWLGIDLDNSELKQNLLAKIKIEENLQSRLRKEGTLSQISQSLFIVNRRIEELEIKKNSLNIDEKYSEDIDALNEIKLNINKSSTELSKLEFRKELINESKSYLETDKATIDADQVRILYQEAKLLVPAIQKTFEETLRFHNEMIEEKIRYITQELPELELKIQSLKRKMTELLLQEKMLAEKIIKIGALEGFQDVIGELNATYEKKGNLEEQKRLWENSLGRVSEIRNQLEEINKGIISKDDLIQDRIRELNKYFSDISYRLYGEEFVLSSDKNDKGYELNISNLAGNPGTGKKKGQIAAFDLAYIQFADSLGIECLHFVLQDQIENVHDNQISNLFTEIVSGINCQYVLPVLRDKLPSDIDISQYQVLSLSQSSKLFLLDWDATLE